MKNKVLFLIGTLSGGGAERVVSNLSMNLPENIEKEIILFGANSKIEYEYSGSIKYLDQVELKGPLSKTLAFIKRIRALKRIKKNNPNTTIISFLEYPNLLNMLSGSTDNSIVSVRNFMSTKHKHGMKAYLWNMTIKKFYGRAKEIIVVSDEMKNDLIENYGLPNNKIKIIYNSYPIEDIYKLGQEDLNTKEKKIFEHPVIITAGRLSEQKGQHHLLEAFSKVKKAVPECQLIFLGEGNLEKPLREQALNLNIENSVHFFGFQQNPFKYIAKSRVFVMTSYYEGFPNALAEAMACKVPVISTKCPSGPEEILAPRSNGESNDSNHIYGHLVPAFSEDNKVKVEDEISEIIIKLLEDKDLNKYYSAKAFERVQDFEIKEIIKDWDSLII